MLSDRERETLREIHRQLATEDPDLASKLDRVEPPAPAGRGRSAYLAAWIASSVMMFVLLAAQSAFGTLFFVVTTVVSGVLYLRADHRIRRQL
ncbi:MAG: DUF3040 domain-containing protein [Actinomycetota bacterium]|nr:DUF3040 domain-containing protein [Actinomycetota bacterium]